jgi:hypothetical protein
MPALLRSAEQAWHGPLQSELQQTLSAQNPDWHWLAEEQIEPLPRSAAQCPELSQYDQVVHWASVAHVVPQSPLDAVHK